MIVIIDYIFKKYICKMGCALHKKAHALRAPCALVRLAPFTTMREGLLLLVGFAWLCIGVLISQDF